MFKVTVSGKDIGSFGKYEEAFEAFFHGITKLVEGGTSYQMLETTCWISCEYLIHGERQVISLSWYSARDWAYHLGLMKDRELVRPLPKINPQIAFATFIAAKEEAALETLAY